MMTASKSDAAQHQQPCGFMPYTSRCQTLYSKVRRDTNSVPPPAWSGNATGELDTLQ